MNNTNNNNNNNFGGSRQWFWTKFWVGFFAVVAIGFATAILIKESAGSGDAGAGVVGSSGGLNGSVDVGAVPSPQPDDISVSKSLDGSGDQIVVDKTGGYFFAMPGTWYVEKNAGAGLTVYPDYTPTDSTSATTDVAASSTAPTCKIEVSSFAVATGTDLNDWLSHYFAADPTAQIAQTSLSQIAIPGAAAALEWRGTMNNVTTTLVYAQAADGGNATDSAAAGEILEIAPSSLSKASDADNDDCDPALQQFLSNLTFGNYGKNI